VAEDPFSIYYTNGFIITKDSDFGSLALPSSPILTDRSMLAMLSNVYHATMATPYLVFLLDTQLWVCYVFSHLKSLRIYTIFSPLKGCL
jgi:hypothetical protein